MSRWYNNYRGRRWGYNGNRSYRNRRRRSSRADRLTRFAFNLAQVQQGLKNPESRIAASYTKGSEKVESTRKPLF